MALGSESTLPNYKQCALTEREAVELGLGEELQLVVELGNRRVRHESSGKYRDLAGPEAVNELAATRVWKAEPGMYRPQRRSKVGVGDFKALRTWSETMVACTSYPR